MSNIKNCTVAFKVSEEKKKQYENYAKLHNISLGKLIRLSLDEMVEDDISTDVISNDDDMNNDKYFIIPVSKQLFDEITNLAKESGVPRTAFLRNRIKEGYQEFINIDLKLDGLDDLTAEMMALNKSNRNILKMMEGAKGVFSTREHSLIQENIQKIEKHTSDYVTGLRLLQIRVDKTVDKIVNKRLSKKKKNEKH